MERLKGRGGWKVGWNDEWKKRWRSKDAFTNESEEGNKEWMYERVNEWNDKRKKVCFNIWLNKWIKIVRFEN